MIEIVWEFIVREETLGQFELAYGLGGAWGKLFAGCSGFRGTTLLRDIEDPRRYLRVDMWDTVAQWEQVLAEHEVEYAELLATLAGWIESDREVGVFTIRSEATVRPSSKARRGRGGKGKMRPRI
jgi:heme-degrading monooxygenase HmoA